MPVTPISKTGLVTCRHCGEKCEVDVSRQHGWGRCTCGKSVQYGQVSTTVPGIFELFGIELSLDYDGQLLAESAYELSEPIRQWLFDHQGEIRQGIEWIGRKQRAVYIGGARNGQPHTYLRGGSSNEPVYVHVARAHWETYEFRGDDDPRLFFAGRSTSKVKARRGVFVVTESKKTP